MEKLNSLDKTYQKQFFIISIPKNILTRSSQQQSKKQQPQDKKLFNLLMGAQTTKTSQGQQTIQIDHPIFQTAIVHEQKNKTFMSVSLAVEQKQYQKWKMKLSNAKSPVQFLLLPEYHSFTTKGLCGSTGFVQVLFCSIMFQITYHSYPYILMQQIQQRIRRKSTFQQSQLWFLLYTLSAGQVQMQQLFDTKIGDIRPHNIFLNQQGEIRISCLQSWPGERSAYQKAVELQQGYLAPQEITKLQLGAGDDLQNYTTEMFSIGMTILSVGMLRDFLFLYDLNKIRFDYERFVQCVQEWKMNTLYSEIFTAIIVNLVSCQVETRLTMKQLWTFLSSYQIQIKRKSKFVIRNAPTKIEKAIQQLRSFKSFITKSKLQSQLSPRQQQQQSLNYRSGLLQKAPSYVESVIYSQVRGRQQNIAHSRVQRVGSPMLTFNNIVRPLLVQTVPLQVKQQNNQTLQQSIPEPQINQLQQSQKQPKETLNSNNINTYSHQVQTFFSSPQSIVSQNDNFTANGGDFVYTRRIVNLNTNSLLAQESINQEEYYQGIRRKISSEDYQ